MPLRSALLLAGTAPHKGIANIERYRGGSKYQADIVALTLLNLRSCVSLVQRALCKGSELEMELR